MALVQLIYHSRNTLDADDRSQLVNLREILEIARRKNGEEGVTGYLIFDKAYFLQILEGEEKVVEATYRRIAGDKRHADVTLVGKRAIAMRTFPDWSMGSAMRSIDHEEVYLQHGISGAIDPSRLDGAKILSLATDLHALEQSRRRPAA